MKEGEAQLGGTARQGDVTVHTHAIRRDLSEGGKLQQQRNRDLVRYRIRIGLVCEKVTV